jgi:Flp pilus assembly protein TadD
MRTLRARVLVPCLLALILAAGARQARATELTSREVYHNTLKATAWVVTPRGSGSGFVVDRAARLLVTNHHVVTTNKTVKVYFPVRKDGKVIAEKSHYRKEQPIIGTVIDSDPTRDLAVVQLPWLPETVGELKLADEGVEPGDRLFTIGNPGASDALWVFGTGTVRNVYLKTMRFRGGQVVKARVIEMSVPINPGDSGGPIVNQRGELVGVNDATNPRGSLFTYGIEVSEVRAYLPRVSKLLSPATPADFAERGEHYAGRGRLDLAVADFQEVIRRDPRHAGAHLGLGLALQRLGDHERAALALGKAIELAPRNARAHHARSLAFEQMSRLDEAVMDLDVVLSLEPAHPTARLERGLMLQRKGALDQAIADFSEVLRQAPRNASALKARGSAWLTKGELDKALTDLSAAIRAAPRDAEAYLLRSKAHARKGDYASALADQKKADEVKARPAFSFFPVPPVPSEEN